MISVENARQLLLENRLHLASSQKSLADSSGYFLAKDILSPFDHPFFDYSAVDGYALSLSETSDEFITAEIIGQIQPGDKNILKLEPGKAIRIFTGAAIPQGCDLVVMQEKTERTGNSIRVPAKQHNAGANIRRKGEQVKKGGLALAKGSFLNPASVGHLATLGIKEVEVHDKPSVTVIVTGNEFLQENEEPGGSKIFESNGIMLQALLKCAGIQAKILRCPDNLSMLSSLLREETDTSLVLITGGASVGEFDFTRSALESCGHQIIFHGVNQKPGKPLLFSKTGLQAAFGLPGNPRAVLLCFYLYVLPFLKAAQGANDPFTPPLHLPLADAFEKKDGKTHFITVNPEGGKAHILPKQASHMLESASGNLYIACLPAEKNIFTAGEMVQVYPAE